MRHGIESSVEHPGYVNVPLEGGASLAIGTANLEWGCDLNQSDSNCESLWSLPLDSDADTIADHIHAESERQNSTPSDDERSNGPRR